MLDIYRNHTGHSDWIEIKPNNRRMPLPSHTKNSSARSVPGGVQATNGTRAEKTDTTRWRVVAYDSSILNQVPGEKSPTGLSIAGVKPQKPSISNALYGNYTRQSANEMDVLFPRLPNPDISIFIYPHLATANNVPIPGYTTVIPLYEQIEYALPGEAMLFSTGRRYGNLQ